MDTHRLAHDPNRFPAPAADWDVHTVNEQPNQKEAYEVMNGVAVKKLKTVYKDENGEEKKIVQYEVSFKVTDRYGDASRVMTLVTTDGMGLKKTMQMVKTMQLACRKFDRDQFVYFTDRSYFQLEEAGSPNKFTLLVHDPRYNELCGLISPTRSPTHAILRPMGDRKKYQLAFNFDKTVKGKEGYNELAESQTFKQKAMRVLASSLGPVASKLGVETYNHSKEIDRMVNVWERVLSQPDADDTYDAVVDGWEKEGALAGSHVPKLRTATFAAADVDTLRDAYTVAHERYHAKRKLAAQLEKGIEAVKCDHNTPPNKLAIMERDLELVKLNMEIARAQADALEDMIISKQTHLNPMRMSIPQLQRIDGFVDHAKETAELLNKYANKLHKVRKMLAYPSQRGRRTVAGLRKQAAELTEGMQNVRDIAKLSQKLAARLLDANVRNEAELHGEMGKLSRALDREREILFGGHPRAQRQVKREQANQLIDGVRAFEKAAPEVQHPLGTYIGLPDPLATRIEFA